MVEWLTTLPEPQKNISIIPGDSRLERRLQSGRTEFRRFGDGKPDQARVLIRMLWSQYEDFQFFYERTLNLGINWFSASWLTTLGYNDHKAKFLGYPREVARQGYYVDILCNLLIQKTDWVIGEDTVWPCSGGGGVAPSTWAQGAAIYLDVNLSVETQSAEWVDGSAISNWENQTNEGYDFVTFGDTGPTYRAEGWNGYPAALEFPNLYYGAQSKLRVQQTGSCFVSSASGWSLAFCGRWHRHSADPSQDNWLTRVIKATLSVEGDLHFIVQSFPFYVRYYTSPTVYAACQPNFLATSGYNAIHLLEFHSDNINVKTYLDGVLKYTITPFKFVSLSDSLIYLGNNVTGNKYTIPGLYHMMVYHADGPMSEENRTAMRNDCSTQYGVIL